MWELRQPSYNNIPYFQFLSATSRLRYAERATSLTNGLALRQSHLGFAQHADNLFWGVAFTAHSIPFSRGKMRQTL